MRLAPAALLALVAALPGSAAAQVTKGTATIRTTNTYKDRAMWITIYDLGKTRHLDYGCVNAGSLRDWRSGNYLYGSFYYVRAEVKEGPDCGGRTLCDTTIQVNPQTPGPVDPTGASYSYHTGDTVWLAPNGNNCYFAKSAPAPAPAPALTPAAARVSPPCKPAPRRP
jgi:hypothetical protein